MKAWAAERELWACTSLTVMWVAEFWSWYREKCMNCGGVSACLMKLCARTLLTSLTRLHSLACDNFQHDQVSKISSERSGTPKKRKAPPPPISPAQVNTTQPPGTRTSRGAVLSFCVLATKNVLELSLQCTWKIFLYKLWSGGFWWLEWK